MRLFRRGEVDASVDLLVAGLGNPGAEHARDRHNVGWMVVDELARRHAGSFKGKFRGRLADVRDGAGTLLAQYTYDANGNRTAVKTGSTVTATFDAQDRQLTDGSASFTESDAGSLTSCFAPATSVSAPAIALPVTPSV